MKLLLTARQIPKLVTIHSHPIPNGWCIPRRFPMDNLLFGFIIFLKQKIINSPTAYIATILLCFLTMGIIYFSFQTATSILIYLALNSTIFMKMLHGFMQ